MRFGNSAAVAHLFDRALHLGKGLVACRFVPGQIMWRNVGFAAPFPGRQHDAPQGQQNQYHNYKIHTLQIGNGTRSIKETASC